MQYYRYKIVHWNILHTLYIQITDNYIDTNYKIHTALCWEYQINTECWWSVMTDLLVNTKSTNNRTECEGRSCLDMWNHCAAPEVRLKRMDLRLRPRKAWSVGQPRSSSWIIPTIVYTSKYFLLHLKGEIGIYQIQ